MFGYITINQAELKFREYDWYHSFYCGLCRQLKKGKYGLQGQMTLTYDMTFLVILLTGLYMGRGRPCGRRAARAPGALGMRREPMSLPRATAAM